VRLRSIVPVATVIAISLLSAERTDAQSRRSGHSGTEPRGTKAAGAPGPPEEQPDRTIDVSVTEKGFEPARITLKKDERVRLVFTRTTDNTCAKILVIDEFLVWNELALGKPVAITFTAGRPGEFPYTCPTRQAHGLIKVEERSHLTESAGVTAGPTTVDSIALPGGPPVGMDYLAFDAATGRLWVPAGNTGRVDVLDTRTGKLESIEGIATEKRGDRVVGASSAAVGDGVVYVGNRADTSVCAFDARTLARKGCVTLASAPDGLAYVPTTKEVWVTMPQDKSIAVLALSASRAPKLSGTIRLAGVPEGYAVDPGRGLFYTNLEDKDDTVVLSVRLRKVVASWKPDCGEKGPRGLALDPERGQLFVACTDRLKTLNAAKDGAVLSELSTGAGVDNIDYLPSRRLVYAASGTEARLTVATVAEDGALRTTSTSRTAKGCRTVIVDGNGTAYLPDSRGGRLVVVRTSLK
jgi:DNA-binding beta-propeller fold protein YncE/plastocyanin